MVPPDRDLHNRQPDAPPAPPSSAPPISAPPSSATTPGANGNLWNAPATHHSNGVISGPLGLCIKQYLTQLVAKFHEERRSKLGLLLDSERWRPLDTVPPEFQHLLNHIHTHSTFYPSFSSLSFSHLFIAASSHSRLTLHYLFLLAITFQSIHLVIIQ